MGNLLIIEDDLSVQQMFKQFLESNGFTVFCASEGLEGMNLLKQQKVDLIITDIMMPEMDGLEVIQAVQETQPGLPIIAISGGMRDVPINFLPHARKFGACRVFEKPVSLTTLLASVQELLKTE
ncbi:MAG TPA: response regulator [Pontiellaceae bacterium]|nr:response regulator [Pontiellaceae bacterium]HPR82273.1 response regulator [Pontiellaceae bacterium]